MSHHIMESHFIIQHRVTLQDIKKLPQLTVLRLKQIHFLQHNLAYYTIQIIGIMLYEV